MMKKISKKNRVNPNIAKLLTYSMFSNLFFERSIFIIYLGYKGYSIAQIAIWQGLVNLAMTVGEIPTGLIADHIGKKKSLIIGNVMMIIYYCLMLLSKSFVGFVCGAIIFGIGSTFISGTDEALLYDIVEKEKLNKYSVKYLGQLSAIITFSIGCAMFAGGFIQKINWGLVLIAGIVVQSISIVIMAFLPNIRNENMETKNILKNFGSFIKYVKRSSFIISIMLLLGVNIGVVSAVYILAQDLFRVSGYTTAQISEIFTVETIISVIVFSQVDKIQNLLGRMKSLIITLSVSILAFILMNISNKFILVFAVLLISIFNNYFTTILMDIYNTNVPKNFRATAISVLNIFSSLLMSLIFFIVSISDQYYTLLLCIIGVICTAPLYFVIFKFKEKINVETC